VTATVAVTANVNMTVTIDVTATLTVNVIMTVMDMRCAILQTYTAVGGMRVKG
jgi:hypothetical protein